MGRGNRAFFSSGQMSQGAHSGALERSHFSCRHRCCVSSLCCCTSHCTMCMRVQSAASPPHPSLPTPTLVQRPTTRGGRSMRASGPPSLAPCKLGSAAMVHCSILWARPTAPPPAATAASLPASRRRPPACSPAGAPRLLRGMWSSYGRVPPCSQGTCTLPCCAPAARAWACQRLLSGARWRWQPDSRWLHAACSVGGSGAVCDRGWPC